MAELENKNGVITEEALEEIAAGIGTSSSKLKKTLLLAGVAVTSVAALGLGTAAYINSKKAFNPKTATKEDTLHLCGKLSHVTLNDLKNLSDEDKKKYGFLDETKK